MRIANVNTIGTASSNQSSFSFIRRGVPNDINNNIVCVYTQFLLYRSSFSIATFAYQGWG